ncbi:MAG: H(+)/Cl(-) exchange transporter ClcA [Gemmataceae bacterium]
MHHLPYSRPWFVQHLRLVAVGLLTGVAAVAFRQALEWADGSRPWLMSRVGEGPLALAVSVALSVFAVVAAALLVARHCPEASGSGIPDAKALARHPRPIRWARLLAVKFSSGVLGIGGGLALGREGPTVQMGAAVGEMVGGMSGVTPGERRQLIILGAGAGLAGAFNAPLAGAMFVCEELGEDFKPPTALAALLTTFGSDLVSRALTGQYPQLGTYPATPPALGLLPAFLLLGWLGGVLGVMFNQALLAAIRASHVVQRRLGTWVWPLAIGAIIGVLGWLDPRWVGGGDGLFTELRSNPMELGRALFLFGLRFLLTVGSYATGAAGGLFAPLLVMGALLGSGAAHGLAADRNALVIVGMAALFTGCVRTPLTGVLLMVEMAGAFALTIPLLGACLLAKLTADALGDQPIYDALLEEQPRARRAMGNEQTPPS